MSVCLLPAIPVLISDSPADTEAGVVSAGGGGGEGGVSPVLNDKTEACWSVSRLLLVLK